MVVLPRPPPAGLFICFSGFSGATLSRNNPYETGLDRNPANHVPLSPLSFLARAAEVYPDRTAVIHGDHEATWREIYRRCRRLASALVRRGIGLGDTVAVLGPHLPAVVRCPFCPPLACPVVHN